MTLVEPAPVMAADILEAEAYRRALEGREKPVGWYKGKPGGYVREYSDVLLMSLLKGASPLMPQAATATAFIFNGPGPKPARAAGCQTRSRSSMALRSRRPPSVEVDPGWPGSRARTCSRRADLLLVEPM